MVRKLVLAVAAASALMSSNMVQALGVGEIHLRSSLNQPLEAEIELLQVRDLTSGDIRSVLASADAFGTAGIDRSFFLTDLKFTPTIRPDGKSVIKVTSTRPVKEPYLNFLMEVRWPSGRVLREFTLLLDPPMYQPTSVTAPVIRPVPSANSTTTGTLARPAVPAVRPVPAAPTQGSVAGAASAATPGEWQASRNDTLWEIALQHRPGSATVHQTMLAIQDLNPNAFIAGNINSLKAGQTLALPTAEQANARSQADAVAEVASQNGSWQNRQPTTETASRQLDARERSAAGPAPATTKSDDALRLVSGNDESADNHTDSAADGQNGGLRDALDLTKEQLDSSERENIELNERLSDVQAQLQTLQRLVALKDAQLAALQQELGSAGELADILPVPVENAESLDELALVAQMDATEQATADSAAAASALAQLPAENSSEMNVASAEQPAASLPAEPQAADLPAVAPIAQEQPLDSKSPESLLQQFMQNQTLLLGTGAAALLLLLLLLMAVARRNARREMELADDFDGAPLGHAGDEAGESDDFNVALASAVDADLGINQDPLTEADGLIAYAQLDEAAQVLETAIEQEPKRADLRLKMMEVEARRENPEGYAAQAEALREAGMADDAVDMMNLRYPLMAAGLMTGAMLLDGNVESDGSEEVTADPVSLESEEADFDFSNFGLEEDAAASLAESSVASEGFDLDFDLDEPLSAEVPPASDSLLESDTLDDGFSVDFSTLVAPVADTAGEDELILDDELQADNLLAEFEAMSLDDVSDELEIVADIAVDKATKKSAEPEQTFSLSDEDLAGFEAELQTAMDTESKRHDELDANGEVLNSLSESSVFDDDLDSDDFDFLTDTDECATKLDLARAYIDMGDADGARDILTEVVDEGNSQQQQDAREMMEQLS